MVTIEELEHLEWIHDRMIHKYKENPNTDFLIKMREILGSLEIKNIKLYYKYKDGMHIFSDNKEFSGAGSIFYYNIMYNTYAIARLSALLELKNLKART